ncbi:MAG: CPBP family intramembrane metalloprotease [Labilithrix sp.]|nr:CPBP family intramembrane metalloprotease [Labilithrix sp.]MCW5816377.1 CPBP family intramembrane metalloprotease [Labilithrix sp.]
MSDDDKDDDAPRPRGLSVLAWGLGLYGACRVLQIFLEAQATAAAVGQAVLVEWGTSRLGVVWTPHDRKASLPDGVRRGMFGALAGFAIAGVLLGVLVVSGGAKLEAVSSASVSVLVIGLVTAGLYAWRDELLFHGVTLRALGMFEPGDRASAQDLFRVVACGVTSAGAALGRSDASARSVVVAALLGVAFGALWTRDRGAWMPWGAHMAFRFATDTLVAGGVVQVRLASSAWAGGDSGLFGGTAAAVALVPVATVAIALTMRGISPDPARVG